MTAAVGEVLANQIGVPHQHVELVMALCIGVIVALAVSILSALLKLNGIDRTVQHEQRQRVHGQRRRLSLLDEAVTHTVRPMFVDDDAIHMMQTCQEAYDYYRRQPYRLKQDTITPSDSHMAARITCNQRLIITSMRDFRHRIRHANRHERAMGVRLPSSLTSLELKDYRVQRIRNGALPSSLKRLSIEAEGQVCSVTHFNNALPKGLTTLMIDTRHYLHPVKHLPSSLTILQLSDRDELTFAPGCLPPTLTILECGFITGPILDGVFPSALTHLGCNFKSIASQLWPTLVTHFTWKSEQSYPLLGGYWPQSLTRLQLDSFSRPLTAHELPASITYLVLGNYPNPILRGVLPPNLQHFEYYYDGHIEFNALPNSLTYIKLGWNYNRPLPPTLPSSLITLQFAYDFDQPLQHGLLPNTLVHLHLSRDFNHIITPGTLPLSLMTLEMGPQYNHPISRGVLPPSLTVLAINDHPDTPRDIIPDTVTDLTLDSRYKQREIVLPQTLRRLTFGEEANYIVTPGFLPAGLTYLCMGYAFKQKLMRGSLPTSLTSLILSGNYKIPLDTGVLPPSLRVFGELNDELIESRPILPPGLTDLTCGQYFRYPINRHNLPPGLTALELNFDYRLPISSDDLPISLRKLTIPDTYPHSLVGRFAVETKTESR